MDKELLRELYGDAHASSYPHSAVCRSYRMQYIQRDGGGRPQQQQVSFADTLQRKAAMGNLLEIIDLRSTPKVQEGVVRWADAIRESACGPGLRGGWNASRKCHCDEGRLIVNCRASGLSREVRARHRPVALHARRLRQAVYDGPSPGSSRPL